MAEVVLGVDAGTSALKAGLFTTAGELLGVARAAYPLLVPEPEAAEQNANEWWAALAATSRQLLSSGTDQLVAVAIGGQAPTLVAVDADLTPSEAAITWLDRRAASEAERLYAQLGQPVPAWGSWPAQASWFARHRPAAMRRTRWLMGCPDYLVARLTGEPVSLLEWPAVDLDAAEIDGRLVPPVRGPGEIVGSVSRAAARVTGLPVGTPVVSGFIDGVMAVLGSGVQNVGDACIGAGTSGTVSVLTEPGRGYPALGKHLAGAATNTSGKALDWLIQAFGIHGADYEALIATASEITPGAAGLLFLPHLAGERAPVADARARGAWVGLTLDHDRRHLLRAVLEGVAFGFRTLFDVLVDSGATIGEVRCVGGQARSDLWNQIKADVLCRTVLVPRVLDAAVVGAAILACTGVGAYPSLGEAQNALVRVRHAFEPDPARARRYDELYAAYRELYPALREINWRLSAL